MYLSVGILQARLYYDGIKYQIELGSLMQIICLLVVLNCATEYYTSIETRGRADLNTESKSKKEAKK